MSIPKGTLFDTHKVRFNVIKSALKEIECAQTDSDNSARIIWWDGYMKREEFLNMYPHQRINRIPAMDQICYKSNTFTALNKLRKIDRDLFNFFPLTYILPNEYEQFKNEAESMLKKNQELKIDNPTWIFKPRNGQCGIGIQLFQDPSTVSDTQKYNGVVQSYISPHLHNGVKFDLRLYLFVSTIEPYTIFLYNEGLARFCTEQYVKPSTDNLNDLYMHLTNTSVNIKNQQADKSSYLQFASPILNKINKPDLWQKIKRVAALSMIAQYHQIIEQIEREEITLSESNLHFKAALNHKPNESNNDKNEDGSNKDIVDLPPINKLHRYFHLVGIDILINDKYEPMLLEMNDRPSMFVSFEDIERELKKNLVKEALSLISLDGSPVNKDIGKWERILPDPKDEEFNKKAELLMSKSLIKPISSFSAVKNTVLVQKKVEPKVKKTVQTSQTNASQVPKKLSPVDQVAYSQPPKKTVQSDKVHASQHPTAEPTSSVQLNKNADKAASAQIVKKLSQTEKPKKIAQQEVNLTQSTYLSTSIHQKPREKSPDHSRNEELHSSQPKKKKVQNPSPEKALIRTSYSSKTTPKDLKASASTSFENQIRRSQDHFNISSDASPIAKKTKPPTYPKQIKQTMPKKSSTVKQENISSVSSGNTLPPLEQNKEISKSGKGRGKHQPSNLPTIVGAYNCQ